MTNHKYDELGFSTLTIAPGRTIIRIHNNVNAYNCLAAWVLVLSRPCNDGNPRGCASERKGSALICSIYEGKGLSRARDAVPHGGAPWKYAMLAVRRVCNSTVCPLAVVTSSSTSLTLGFRPDDLSTAKIWKPAFLSSDERVAVPANSSTTNSGHMVLQNLLVLHRRTTQEDEN